jgi:Cu(I)/Ag(I) efflux system membrane fusion protein
MITHTRLPWVLAASVLILAAGAAAGYWAASRSAQSRAAGADVERKVLYWHDPMVPNVRFDKPGQSPYMNMPLVPVYADEGTPGSREVRVSSSVSQNLGIRLGKVEKSTLQQQFAAVGTVAFDESLLELVQARVEGFVTRLYVKTPLEQVRRGERLAEIQAPAWIEAQQEYLALLDAKSERAQAVRSAARDRLRVLGVPPAVIREIESERRTDATTTVVAPIDGVVSELGVREGSAFMPGAPLFRLNGLSSVWVNAQIPEVQVSMIPPGSTVTARATAWPGMTFKGRIVALLPEVDSKTRTLTARVSLENPERRLSPGMYVSLEFVAPRSEPQLVVPSEAVITTGERSVVIAVGEGGSFEVVDVSVGSDHGDRTAILSGLKEGQSIVLSGQFLIDSEASLRSAVGRLESNTATSAADQSGAAAGTPMHLSQGHITALTPQEITIAHEPVPSLDWPAMTMGFKAPARGVPQDLKVGDPVSFSFSKAADGSFRIERIAPLAVAPAGPQP